MLHSDSFPVTREGVGDRSAQPEQQEAARQALVLQEKQEPLHPPNQAGVLRWIWGVFLF